MAANKHVVVDKPFTVTLAEARELASQAKRAGCMLSVFHNRRWDADYLTVRNLLAAGTLGDVVHFESHFDRYQPIVCTRWREKAGAGSGIWYDLGPHLVDQALQLFGPPRAIYADFAQQRSGAEAVDYFHVLLRYERLRVILHGSTLVAGESPRFVIHGGAGSYSKYGLDTQESTLKRERPGGPNWGHDPRKGTLVRSSTEGIRVDAHINQPGDYRVYYAGVARAIQTGAPNPVPAEEAIAVMAMIDLANKSAATGCEVPVDLGVCTLP